MKHITYGYARVSTKEQHEDRQLKALKEYGVAVNKIFLDKLSGKNFDRPQYCRLLAKLKPDDVFIVQSIDRLGRDYEEIIDQWHLITKEKKASIVVLDMPLLDTRRGRDLTGTLIADIVLQLLSYVAQREREMIRQRQAEGIAIAKEKGIRFGPKPMKRPENYAMCLAAWKAQEISARAAARALNITHKTFIRWAQLDAEAESMPNKP